MQWLAQDPRATRAFLEAHGSFQNVGRLFLSSTVVQQVGQFPFPGPAKPDVQTWLVLNPPGASPAMTLWTPLHKVSGAAGSRL